MVPADGASHPWNPLELPPAAAARAGRVAVSPAATTKPSRQPPACTAIPAIGAATAMPAALAEFIHVFAWV